MVLMLAALASCGGQPYVHVAGVYNRNSEVFKKGLADRSEVTVCYSKRKASPAEVTRLAVEECARFGKRARFSDQTLMTCPLFAPVGAVFECLADAASQGIRR